MKKYIALILSLTLSISLFGAVRIVNFNVQEGDWAEAGNWKPDGIPEGNTFATVANNRTAIISKETPVLRSFMLGSSNTGGTIRLIDGGRLVISDQNALVFREQSGASALFEMSGGEISGTSGSGFLLNVGSAKVESTGEAVISGGKFIGGFRVGGVHPGHGKGILRIRGSKAELRANGNRDVIILNANGKIAFELDAEGVSTLKNGLANINLAEGSEIVVDGGQYKGGSKVITLMEGKLISNKGAKASVTGFPEGVSAELSFATKGAVTLKITRQ